MHTSASEKSYKLPQVRLAEDKDRETSPKSAISTSPASPQAKTPTETELRSAQEAVSKFIQVKFKEPPR